MPADATEPIRRSYDTVARAYGDNIAGELAGKPIDRALYRAFGDLVRDELDADNAVGAARQVRVGDVGCGPGHVTAYLRSLGLDAIGIDLSPGMIDEARHRFPEVNFRVGSMVERGGLGEPDGAWAGAIAAYSIVHFDVLHRARAFAELARVIRPRGWLVVSFHIEDAQRPRGSVSHLSDWWDHAVDLDFHFLDPGLVAGELRAAGFSLVARTDREPLPGREAPTRRCYLLARRDGGRPAAQPDPA